MHYFEGEFTSQKFLLSCFVSATYATNRSKVLLFWTQRANFSWFPLLQGQNSRTFTSTSLFLWCSLSKQKKKKNKHCLCKFCHVFLAVIIMVKLITRELLGFSVSPYWFCQVFKEEYGGRKFHLMKTSISTEEVDRCNDHKSKRSKPISISNEGTFCLYNIQNYY